MRIGILADIHEAIEPLHRALDKFQSLDVDCIVNLGDACDTFSTLGRANEVVALLRGAGAVGVWGNHDFGLSYEVPEVLRKDTSSDVLDFMATMRPSLIIDDCRFTHVEPWLNPHKAEDLWCYDGLPNAPEKVGRSFSAVPEQRLFIGHFHTWLIMTPSRQVRWGGDRTIALSESALTPLSCGA
jgi:hypothetical protein